MNIILLVIDTLRYGLLGANGNREVETPYLDRLVEGAWAFDRAFCSSYPTIPCRHDLMEGHSGGPFHPWRPLRHDALAFPRLLAEAGWATQLIHDTPHLVNGGHNFDWPFSAWTFVRGAEVDRPWVQGRVEWPPNWGRDPLFDVLGEEVPDSGHLRTYCWANRDRQTLADWNCMQLFRTAADFLRDNAGRDRVFLWIDCFDPHEPWDAPPEFILKYDRAPDYDGRIDPRSLQARRNDPRLSDAARARIRARYLAKTAWMDHCAGVFLQALEETGLVDDTAVILMGDHGTRLGEFGRFGKGYPVREQEGHIPLFVRVPGETGGRCDALAQPHDLFATICGLAGMEMPAGLDSRDLLATARAGGAGRREIALAGGGTETWVGRFRQSRDAVLFTAFDGEWILEFAMRPEDSGLRRMGSLEEVSAAHPETVARLHAAALDELQRRGADAGLMAWLRSDGETPVPDDCRLWSGWPGPAGFTHYWSRVYTGELSGAEASGPGGAPSP